MTTEWATTATRGLFDEAILGVMRLRRPTWELWQAERIGSEITQASALFDDHGWSADPVTYHRPPPSLSAGDVTAPQTYSWPRRHESITFASQFRPRDIEPGADRWAPSASNGTVFVRLLRHRGPDRPWVVCLHGFGMNASRFDLTTLWANHLHTRGGFNVAVPALPLHGPRRSPDDDQLLSLDLVMTLHGISQAVWDVRRLIGWIRDGGAPAIGVYGLSLGGYLAALLAGLEPVEAVVSGIAFTDVPSLMLHHRPPPDNVATLGSDAAANTFRVVSPLAVTPLPAPQRRAIFAGRADRLIPAGHTAALAQAWPQSPIHWYGGGHTGFMWSPGTKAFVTEFLRDALRPSQP